MCDLLERLRTYEWLWRNAGFDTVADDLLMAADELEELRSIMAKLQVRSPDRDGTMFVEMRTESGRAAMIPLVSQNDRRVARDWQVMLGSLPTKGPATSSQRPRS